MEITPVEKNEWIEKNYYRSACKHLSIYSFAQIRHKNKNRTKTILQFTCTAVL